MIRFKATLITLVLFLSATALFAQMTSYTLQEESEMTITGTSTIHDWEADVKSMTLDLSLNPAALTDTQNFVSGLTLMVPVEDIDSGKGGMDKRIDKALKKDDHPNVIFELTSASVTVSDSLDINGKFMLEVEGNMTIAGFTKTVTFPVNGQKMDDGTYRFSGFYHMNMKDYEVDPPSAMFGTIKSGEEVDIHFDIAVKETQTSS